MTIGIDEVGRGCWAGPLVAGAVLLDEPIEGLKDSKLLSKKRRDVLDVVIREESLGYGLGWVDPGDIDTSGITTAVKTAMSRALDDLRTRYEEVHGEPLGDVEIIIDGNSNYLPDEPMARAVIKADLTEPSASAGSIIAKVARDNYMIDMAAKYPQYGFEKHVGYGTAVHIAALQAHGVCSIHRMSYKPIKKIVGQA